MTETVNTPSRARPADATVMSPRAIALLVAGLGTAVYCALAFGMSSPSGSDRFGAFAYNYYFLALIEGRFDVPLRVITLEGAFDPAGRAFIYYGIAPLITRAIAWPFVDLTAVSLAPLTIWLAAAGGTAVYHLVFVQTLARYGPPDPAFQRSAGLLLGLMIWFASPGLLLVANTAIYHEPTAMAYLFMACFLGLLAQVVLFNKDIGSVLLPLAVFAGLSVYGRPHLAIGLYAVVCLLSVVLLRQNGWRALGRTACAMAILLLFGGGLLVFNELRFGNLLQLGSGGGVQHAVPYWGTESVNSERFLAFREHGRFNAYRIVPNLMLYLFDLGVGHLGDTIERVYRYMTSGLGYIRIEHPRVGMVFYWLPWFMLALAGARSGSAGLRHAWVPLLATAIGGLMMASYGTVTLRYRFDIWPVLMALAMLSLPRILVHLNTDRKCAAAFSRTLPRALLISLIIMPAVIFGYSLRFAEFGLYSQWSYETCAEMVTAKDGLGPDAVGRLCGL
jgi:hypothetical protein